jgi:hypothetical protein
LPDNYFNWFTNVSIKVCGTETNLFHILYIGILSLKFTASITENQWLEHVGLRYLQQFREGTFNESFQVANRPLLGKCNIDNMLGIEKDNFSKCK